MRHARSLLLRPPSAAAAPEPTKDEGRQMRRATQSTASLSDLSLCSQPEMDAAAPLPPPDKASDPFLYFSSDKRRMEHLLGKELPSMPSEEPTRRKTRISFELDPFHLMMTSFPELLDDLGEEEKKDNK